MRQESAFVQSEIFFPLYLHCLSFREGYSFLYPVLAFAGFFGWSFLERRYFCQYSAAPIQTPWRQAARSYQCGREILRCNPNVFIRTRLTFGIQASNSAGASSPAPALGWAASCSRFSEVCDKGFLDALFRWENWSWRAQGNCGYQSEPRLITKGCEYKELRASRSLGTWREGIFFAFFFSCGKERKCLGIASRGKMYSAESDFSWLLLFAVDAFPGKYNEDSYDC